MAILGWNAVSEQYDPLDMLEQEVAAEQAGFESTSASDYFHPWDPSGESCNIWTWLGAAPARLNGIEIGTGVTCPILRYNPVTLSQSAATIDRMNKGGFYPGGGIGEVMNEYQTTGLWPVYNKRQGMMRDLTGFTFIPQARINTNSSRATGRMCFR